MVNKEFVKIIVDTGQIIYVPIATLDNLGISKPDGKTLTIEDGVLSIDGTLLAGVVKSVNGILPNQATGNVVLNRVDSVEVEVNW